MLKGVAVMKMKIDKPTIIRTVIFIIALVNVILQMFDIKTLPIDNELVNEAVSVVFLLVGSLSAWWKNNSFTKSAIEADEYLKNIKRKGE